MDSLKDTITYCSIHPGQVGVLIKHRHDSDSILQGKDLLHWVKPTHLNINLFLEAWEQMIFFFNRKKQWLKPKSWARRYRQGVIWYIVWEGRPYLQCLRRSPSIWFCHDTERALESRSILTGLSYESKFTFHSYEQHAQRYYFQTPVMLSYYFCLLIFYIY